MSNTASTSKKSGSQEGDSSAKSDKPPLVLVDGSAYLYRAFHAMPPLTNAAGQSTGAIYGVVNMLRKLIGDHRPELMAVVFDASGKTFRDDIYSEYKANRERMPDELRSQINPLHQVVEKMGLPLLVVEGVEADDVIGTLCVAATQAGMNTLVSTGDKDMAQLVDANVTLVNTMTDTIMDEAGVREKFGVEPRQIIDYLTLVGDTSDNIPGVPGCGPKTAAKWLAAYDNLDKLIASADEIKGKIGERLREALPQLPISKELATIRLDVELPQKVTELTLNDPDVEGLGALYRELEFRTWSRELADGLSPLLKPDDNARGTRSGGRRGTGATGNVAAAAAARAASGGEGSAAVGDDSIERDYTIITDADEFERWVTELEAAELFAFDTETDSLNYMQANIVGIAFATAPGKAAYVPLGHDYEDAPAQLDINTVLERLKPLLESDRKSLVGQHIKYDINVLRRYGISVRNVAHDTMLESYVLDSTATRHDMDSLALRYLGLHTVTFEQIAGKARSRKP